MNSKLTPFLAGLFIGGALAWGFITTRPPKPDPGATAAVAAALSQAADSSNRLTALDEQLSRTKARTQKLEADNLQLATKVQELLKQVDSTPKPKPQKTGLAAMFGGEDGETNGAGSAMRQMMKAAIEQQMEGKITRMKSRLNLTPDQEKAAREILGRASALGQETAVKMLKGDVKPSDLAKAGANTESDLKALLSPEQRVGYEQLQQEEVANNARLIANSELLQMQQTLGLDQAQQDKVFAVLFEQSKAQLAGALNPSATDGSNNPFKSIDDMMQKKLEALKPVLSDEQLTSYKKFQDQQIKLIQSFMPKDGKPGDIAVPQIQVLPKP